MLILSVLICDKELSYLRADTVFSVKGGAPKTEVCRCLVEVVDEDGVGFLQTFVRLSVGFFHGYLVSPLHFVVEDAVCHQLRAIGDAEVAGAIYKAVG